MDRLALSTRSDEDLVSLYLTSGLSEQDREIILSILYDRYEERILSYYRIKLTNEDDADDLALAFWAKILRYLPNFEPRRKGSFRSYLFKTRYTVFMDYLGRQGSQYANLEGSLDEEVKLGDGSSVCRRDLTASDYVLEDDIEFQEKLRVVLDLIDQRFRSAKMKKLARYMLGLEGLPEEYLDCSSRKFSREKSYVKSQLTRWRQEEYGDNPGAPLPG